MRNLTSLGWRQAYVGGGNARNAGTDKALQGMNATEVRLADMVLRPALVEAARKDAISKRGDEHKAATNRVERLNRVATDEAHKYKRQLDKQFKEIAPKQAPFDETTPEAELTSP